MIANFKRSLDARLSLAWAAFCFWAIIALGAAA